VSINWVDWKFDWVDWKFQIIVGGSFVWCPSSGGVEYNADIPICRIYHKEQSLVPGTYLEDGRCRTGYGYEAYYYDEDFEVLKNGKC
jgi:hypothetical protein